MPKNTASAKVRFIEPKDIGERDWGSETLLALVSKKYTLKKLFIKAGCKGGLQYHHMKDECGYVVSGKMIIRYDDGDGLLTERVVGEGDVFHFPPGAVHQEEAITNCVIIEASTPHFNDRVRVEKDYGLEQEGGLPSTLIDDVESVVLGCTRWWLTLVATLRFTILA